jgi:hypothetical protein
LTVGANSSTQTVEVLADPRSDVSTADLAANDAFARSMITRINAARGLILGVRSLRGQLSAQMQALSERGEEGERTLAAGATLRRELEALENLLHNPKAKVVYDVLAGRDGGAKLYNQLAPLYEACIASEHAPTAGMLQQRDRLDAEFAVISTRYQAMLASSKASFDQAVKAYGGGLVTPK